MKHVSNVILLLVVGWMGACSSASSPTDFAPQPVTHEELKAELASRKGNVVVVNFWATWCAPCVREFPELVKFGKEFEAKGVEVVFVSADFEPDLPQAGTFLMKQGVPWETYWIAGKENEFINAIHEDWSGALPTTFIYGKDGTLATFWEGITTYEELERKVTDIINT